MKAYVLGAGVSIAAGYPSDRDLLGKLIKFAELDPRSQLAAEWRRSQGWLEAAQLPGIKAAYEAGDLEYLLTQLDVSFSVGWLMYHRREPAYARSTKEGEQATRNYSDYMQHPETLSANCAREFLMKILAAYFEDRHGREYCSFQKGEWDSLKQFARKLSPGDVVVTFNYDSCLERVLLDQGNWSPGDGYGFTRAFRRSLADTAPVSFCPSRVKVLHLHGSVGWYRDKTSPAGNGHFIVDWNDKISLAPQLLQGFGIEAIDVPSAVPTGTLRESEDLLIYPSILKIYEYGKVFADLWRQAADALRSAENVSVIGYSLPLADVAAWTLLSTTCGRGRVEIVNNDRLANERLRAALEAGPGPPLSFAEWLAGTPDAS